MAERILAVIPCLNEEAYLENVVRGFLPVATSLQMRIVIVDGGSTDRTPQIAQNLAKDNPNISFLQNPKRIQAAAINLAVVTFGTDAQFLIRLDAHAEYPGDYCETLVEEAEKTGAASVVVTMKTAGKNWFQKAVAAAQNSKLGNGGAAHRMAAQNGMWVDHGHHALMRLDAFRSVGGYDESFSHNEDAELDTRLAKAGYRIWLTGKTFLTYYPRSSPIHLFLQYVRFGSGRAQNIFKHHSLPKLRQMAPAAVAPAILLALLTPVCWIAALPAALWAATCLGYGFFLGFKADDMSIAAAGPAAMLMHIGWSLGFWKAVLIRWSRKS